METSFTQYEQCMLVFIFDDSVCMVSTSDNAQEIANTRETFLLHVYDSRTMKCFCFCSILSTPHAEICRPSWSYCIFHTNFFSFSSTMNLTRAEQKRFRKKNNSTINGLMFRRNINAFGRCKTFSQLDSRQLPFY